MRKDPIDVMDVELEIEDAGTGGEAVFMLVDGEAVPMMIPDDEGEEDHDNVDYN